MQKNVQRKLFYKKDKKDSENRTVLQTLIKRGSAYCSAVDQGRYPSIWSGNCDHCRISFLLYEIFLQHLSCRNADRFSMPGLWFDEGWNGSSSFSICGSISYTSDDLSDCGTGVDFLSLPLFFAETDKVSDKICNIASDYNGISLCVSNVEIFPKSGTNDILLWSSLSVFVRICSFFEESMVQ